MEYQESRRSPNYWTLENVIKELKEFISYYPEFKDESSPDFLIRYNRVKLKRAIYLYGGLHELNAKFKLGLNIKHKSLTEKDVLNEIKKLYSQGIEISQPNLIKLKRNDLLGGMQKYGGMNILKEKLGLPIKRHKYWTEEKIIEELEPIVQEYGRLPSEPVFRCLGKYDVFRALKKRGGIKKFAKLLNTISTGYYRSLDGDYLQSSYECLFDNILFKYGVPHKVHGKVSEEYQYRYDFKIHDIFIEICGYDEKEHPEYFKRLKTKVALYKKYQLKYILIPKKIFSSNLVNLENKVVEMLNSILKSSCLVDNKIKAKTELLPAGNLSDIESIIAELMPLIKKYGRMPLDRELRAEKKTSLIHRIYKWYGSLYALGQLLGVSVRHKPKGYYTEQNAVTEYKQLSIEAGHFASLKELQQKRYYGLARFIAKNGGYSKIRLLTGHPFAVNRLPKGYYTYEKARQEYKKLCLQERTLLSSRRLIGMNKASLANYIQTNGGYYKIRKNNDLDFPVLRKPQH